MNLKKLSELEIEKMSLVDISYLLLDEEKKEVNFLEMFNRVSEIKGLSESAKEDKIGQFYTDLNIDGRFVALGSNNWGLKRWYPISQTSEKQITESKKRILEEDELLFTEDEEYKELGLEDEVTEKDEDKEDYDEEEIE